MFFFSVFNHCAYKEYTICFASYTVYSFNKKGFPESLPVKFNNSVGHLISKGTVVYFLFLLLKYFFS